MHTDRLETERLVLRAVSPDDADAAFVWCGDPLVNRYMPYNLYTEIDSLRRFLVDAVNQTGHFGFFRKSDGLLIGMGEIGPGCSEGVWDLGYNLRRDCWNQGYCTEAARAMLQWAHDTHSIHDFAANYAIANPASGAVLRKCGFVFDHEGTYSRFDGSETFPAYFCRLHLD